MEIAKVTSKGQIMIPIDIRRKLGIKEGSKVLFIEEAGKIYLLNSSVEVLQEVQIAFAGKAKKAGLETEADVVTMIKQSGEERMVE